jgi:hypothetical protein
VSVSDLVTPPDDIEALAEWYAQYHERMVQVNRTWRAAKERLLNHVREHGPIAAPSGRLFLKRNGYEWTSEAIDDVALKYPHLISSAVLTVSVEGGAGGEGVSPPIQRIRELAELAYEYEPAAKIEWDTTLDKAQANTLISAGGEVGKYLDTLRKPLTTLDVRR